MKIEPIDKLPKKINMKINPQLIVQAVRVFEDRSHLGLAKVKIRSEVNRTKKKWYKQKGTGGARHGARSAHIFVGGGVVHGPTGVKRFLKLPYKMRKLALKMLMVKAAKEKRLFLIKNVSKVKKTKDIAKITEVAGLVVLSDKNKDKLRYISNLKFVTAKLFRDLNVLDLIRNPKIVIDESVFRKGE